MKEILLELIGGIIMFAIFVSLWILIPIAFTN